MRTGGNGIYNMALNIASLEMKRTTIRPRIASGTPFIFDLRGTLDKVQHDGFGVGPGGGKWTVRIAPQLKRMIVLNVAKEMLKGTMNRCVIILSLMLQKGF
jgi:hypothetical protein